VSNNTTNNNTTTPKHHPRGFGIPPRPPLCAACCVLRQTVDLTTSNPSRTRKTNVVIAPAPPADPQRKAKTLGQFDPFLLLAYFTSSGTPPKSSDKRSRPSSIEPAKDRTTRFTVIGFCSIRCRLNDERRTKRPSDDVGGFERAKPDSEEPGDQRGTNTRSRDKKPNPQTISEGVLVLRNNKILRAMEDSEYL
jgi:hypothetical protein